MAVQETAATFAGVTNENEFFSAHYLAEVFKGDLADTVKAWEEQAEEQDDFTAPHKGLRSLYQAYFALRQKLKTERGAGQRIALQREFFQSLLPVLGLPWQPKNLNVGPNLELPVLADVDGKLWVLGALDPDNEGEDPLSLAPHVDQFVGDGPHDTALTKKDYYHILSDTVFRLDDPPRWVLLLSDRQALLIDRYKWAQNRMLRFDWEEILGRRDDLTLKAVAVMLHKDSLAPDQGESRLDTLDENSHKHAFGVSEDLKYALREAIELLGNEAARQLIERAKERKEGIYSGEGALDAGQLSRECLRYMYRILFLFYIEARPELGYLPYRNETWRTGYSLDSLRDLEQVRLTSEESRQGLFFHHSLQRMFRLIHEGYSGEAQQVLREQWNDDSEEGGEKEIAGGHNAFHLQGLDSHLFDPLRTPLLNLVTFSNETLQHIIRAMSLTRPQKGKRRRGRVSYSQLGINQLGAVYEALLSYRGFFATEDLYEVAPKGKNVNPDALETGYFVNENQLAEFDDDEKVYDNVEGKKKLRVHTKGTFIYRLAGRDRQKSASYYTPEVLTKTLVKYTLKERLTIKGENGEPDKLLPADEILNLTICEPAMGSAAFLNEAVNQLAEAYLTRKQQELDKRIPHEEYRDALQRVKMHIADHNVFGVDLNPIAVELAEVSLWLNALNGDHQVPWFGYQLFAGNSLIGARRQVYPAHCLEKQPKESLWYNRVPRRLSTESLIDASHEGARKSNEIYHFLLPDPGMVGVNDKVAKQLLPQAFNKIKEWKKDFLKPFSKEELRTLQKLSAAVDKLWAEHTQMLARDREKTEDVFAIWGQEVEEYHTSTSDKDRIRREGIFNSNARIASPYRRLKLAMDYWCSLWFWPLDKVDELPDRQKWLFDLNTILNSAGTFSFAPEQSGIEFDGDETEAHSQEGEEPSLAKPQSGLFGDDPQPALREETQAAKSVITNQGELNLEKLFKTPSFQSLKLANELAIRFRFMHWELSFTDIFASRGGFDLILGNPPWIRVRWYEGDILGDFNPQFVLHKLNAAELMRKRSEVFKENPEIEKYWFTELEEAEGVQKFLVAEQNYSVLKGSQTDLYKCFIYVSWILGSTEGISSLLHPEGVYEGGSETLRENIYKRLIYHFQFQNEDKLFPIGNRRKYSINVYRNRKNNVEFISISNIIYPETINLCFSNVGTAVPGIKDENNKWQKYGNNRRLVKINESWLKKLSEISGVENPLNAPLPSLQSEEILSVLFYVYKAENKVENLKDKYKFWDGIHETKYQKNKSIEKVTKFGLSIDGAIYSSPHIWVANPLFQTPKAECSSHRAYDAIDLSSISKTYSPRFNFWKISNLIDTLVPEIEEKGKFKKISELNRLMVRTQLDPAQERTLISCISPVGATHINSLSSTAFSDNYHLVLVAGFAHSIVGDFYIKANSKTGAYEGTISQFPLLDYVASSIKRAISVRVMLLNFLISGYEAIWESMWSNEYPNDSWMTESPILKDIRFKKLRESWGEDLPFRIDYERRQALIELDVLISASLGLTLKELIAIYQIQFPVMKQYESDTFYDVNGRIVFTNSRGLSNVGLNRKGDANERLKVIYPSGQEEDCPLGWEDAINLPDGTKILRTVIDDTLPGGPKEKIITYESPWYLPDREEDYRIAWEVFEKRFKEEVDDAS